MLEFIVLVVLLSWLFSPRRYWWYRSPRAGWYPGFGFYRRGPRAPMPPMGGVPRGPGNFGMGGPHSGFSGMGHGHTHGAGGSRGR